MTEENVCAEFVLSSGEWSTLEAVIRGLTRRGFESYEACRRRIIVSASPSQYKEGLDIQLQKEGIRYVPAKEIVVPDDLKPYVTSISFSASLKFF